MHVLCVYSVLYVCEFWRKEIADCAAWRIEDHWNPSLGDPSLAFLSFALAGNKGAVGVSFMFNGTSFGFVNCHLTSGNEKTTR